MLKGTLFCLAMRFLGLVGLRSKVVDGKIFSVCGWFAGTKTSGVMMQARPGTRRDGEVATAEFVWLQSICIF